MSVILAKSPSTAFIHPISNCLDVCLNTDGYLFTSRSSPFFAAAFDNSIVADGTPFVFFGQYFETNNANTFNTFVWESSNAQTTVDNLTIAFSENALLSGRLTKTILSSSPSLVEVLFAWNELGLRKDFTFSGSIFLGTSQGGNGTYRNGYLINYELWQKDNTGIMSPILPLQSFIPLINTAGIPVDTCIEFKEDISNLLKTTLFWNNTTPQFDETCWSRFSIKYSDQAAKSSGCGIDYLGAAFTPIFEVCNAVCQLYETQETNQGLGADAKLSDYIHTLNPQAKFFTSMPRDANGNIYICGDEYMNMWFYLALAETPTYAIRINCFNENGTFLNVIEFSSLNTNTPLQRFLVVPCGVKNLTTLPVGTAYYQVTVEHNGALVSEALTFYIQPCNCEQEQVYFVCDKLGYDTMKLTRVESTSISVSQTEIYFDVPCGGTVQQNLIGGLSQVNTVAYETFTLLSEKMELNKQNVDWFIQFKKSESRYILRKLSDGTDAVFPLIIDSGDVQIFQFGTDVQLSVTGRYGFDLYTQSEG